MVFIHDTHTGRRYLALTADDCKDATDRNVFELVLSLGQPVTMGSVVGEAAPAQFTTVRDIEVARRAEHIRVTIRDSLLLGSTSAGTPSTVLHYAGLVRTLTERNVVAAARHAVWLTEFALAVGPARIADAMTDASMEVA